MAKQQQTGVEAAIARAGSQSKLAELVGVKQQTVSVWLRNGYVPLMPAVKVELATGVPRKRLIAPNVVAAVGGKQTKQAA